VRNFKGDPPSFVSWTNKLEFAMTFFLMGDFKRGFVKGFDVVA